MCCLPVIFPSSDSLASGFSPPELCTYSLSAIRFLAKRNNSGTISRRAQKKWCGGGGGGYPCRSLMFAMNRASGRYGWRFMAGDVLRFFYVMGLWRVIAIGQVGNSNFGRFDGLVVGWRRVGLHISEY